jgi:hypothetical protein
MGLIYANSNEPFKGRPIPYSEQNANKHYATHFDNLMYLEFIDKNETDNKVRIQAREEIKIANQKMQYWRRHANFDANAIAPILDRIKRNWVK